MSYDYDPQPSGQADQNTFLPKLRHDLITPINIVVGYSSLLLEDWKQSSLEEDLQLENCLKQVHTGGQQLFSLVKRILPPDQSVESVDLTELGASLKAELLLPLNTLIDCCQQLLSQGNADLTPDLARVLAAAQGLGSLINEIGN
jgi:signal transduction histidine kinase